MNTNASYLLLFFLLILFFLPASVNGDLYSSGMRKNERYRAKDVFPTSRDRDRTDQMYKARNYKYYYGDPYYFYASPNPYYYLYDFPYNYDSGKGTSIFKDYKNSSDY